MRSNSDDQTRRFVYRKVDPKIIEERASQSLSSFVQINKSVFPVFKSKSGINKLRILPPTWEGAISYAYQIILHYNVGPDGQRFLCLRMLNKPCPICEERQKLSRGGETDAAKQLRPQDGRVSWIIDRDKEADGPQLWFYGKAAEIEYAMLSLDESGDTLYLDDPEAGFDISFRCDNPGPHAKYSARRIARNPSHLSQDNRRQQQWLDYIMEHPAPDTLNFCSYNYLVEAIGGNVGSEESQEPEHIRSRSLRDEEEDYGRDEAPFDQDTGEVYEGGDDENPPHSQYGDERDEGHLLDNREPKERPRTRLREEAPREVNPSRQARSNLRELRPPSQRPSLRERER
jgi:hypothetical protein